MLSVYPACFYKDCDGYSVVFPDLNWLSTCGANEQDAMCMAVDCLAGYLYFPALDGEKAPMASSVKDVSADKVAKELGVSAEDAFVNLVSVDVEEYARAHFDRSVRKTLTIPAWLDTAAQAENINFSQTLQEALISKIRSTSGASKRYSQKLR